MESLGIVISYFEVGEDYELMIVQDPYGELITIKVNYKAWMN